MTANNLISDTIPPLLPQDTLETAFDWMREFHVEYLPFIDGKNYKGLISENDLLDFEKLFEKIENLNLRLSRPYVMEFEHIYEVIKKMNLHQISVIPVLNKNEEYLGVITARAIVGFFADVSAIKNPGGILILEMDSRDYSLTEISRIVESNDAMILNSTVNTINNSRTIEVALKINRTDLTSTIATFERFGYTIKQTFQESEYDDFLKDRYDSFMNYLDL